MVHGKIRMRSDNEKFEKWKDFEIVNNDHKQQSSCFHQLSAGPRSCPGLAIVQRCPRHRSRRAHRCSGACRPVSSSGRCCEGRRSRTRGPARRGSAAVGCRRSRSARRTTFRSARRSAWELLLFNSENCYFSFWKIYSQKIDFCMDTKI